MLTTLQLVLLASLFIPMLTLMAIVRIWGGIRSIRRGHPPIADKLLRSPGESLRRELEKMDEEEVNDIFVWTFFGPALATTVFVITNSGAKPVAGATLPWIIFIGVLAIVFALLIWRLVYLINRRRSYRLGFTGERAVGEELNPLMLEGCHVFHDVPMEPYGNIDHVIVSPSGIFAVETKTVSKPRFRNGKTGYRVIFDGRLLRFPHRSDGAALGQAEDQAKRLADFLSRAIGERSR
jgi:Nuclease-related domain